MLLLSLGVAADQLGPRVTDWVRIGEPAAIQNGGAWRGEVVFIDHFGNLITNIPGEAAARELLRSIRVAGHEIGNLCRTYAEAAPGELLALLSSSNRLEIAVNQGNAAQRLGAGIGAAVVGSLSTLISVLLGTVIGQRYNGTVVPLVVGLATLAGLSIIVVRWAEAE